MKTENIQYSSDTIFHFAKGFYDIGFNAAYRNKLDGGISGFQRLPSAVVNFNFAAELFLKGIHHCTTYNNYEGHDIYSLFKNLQPDIKNLIEHNYENELLKNENKLSHYKYSITIHEVEPTKSRPINKLKDLLIVHKLSFQQWRYLFENNKSVEYVYDFDKMNCFISSLILLINEKQYGKIIKAPTRGA